MTRNQFGQVLTKELIPGGSKINVTKENRSVDFYYQAVYFSRLSTKFHVQHKVHRSSTEALIVILRHQKN